MDKKTKSIILIGSMIVIIILSFLLIWSLDKDKKQDSSLCSICHKNKRIANASYCYECYKEAEKRVEEKEKQKENATVDPKKPANSSDTKPLDKAQEADPKKPANSSDTTTGSSGKTTSSSTYGKTASSGSSGKTTSSSSKKEYNSLNFDPEDYDDPDEYADDAWDEDFDDYDEAYEYWEDY